MNPTQKLDPDFSYIIVKIKNRQPRLHEVDENTQRGKTN